MIDETAGVVREDPDRFGDTFYATLFELAPHTRALFPDDITEQRLRLVNELTFLVEAATDTDRFTTRARALGERHAGYGVKGSDFEPVRNALLAALREQMDDAWTLDHERS